MYRITISQGVKHGFYTDFYSHARIFSKPCRYFFTRVKNTDFIQIFSLNITLIPGCWKKHHHDRSRVAPVYTGGNTVGEDRTDQSSGSTSSGILRVLHRGSSQAEPSEESGDHTRILRRSPHGFSGRAYGFVGFEGLTTVFFRGKVSNTYPTQGFGDY